MNLRELYIIIIFFWGGANAAIPHYLIVELRVFGGLGKFRVYAWKNGFGSKILGEIPG